MSSKAQDPEKSKIFISYYEEALAVEFREALRSLNLEGFVAGRDIKAGVDFRQAIQQAILNCSAVVCLLTKESQARPWVNYELGLADANQKPVLMVVVEREGIQIGRHPIGNRQFTGRAHHHVKQLLMTIVETMGLTVLPSPEKLDDIATRLVYNLDHILREEKQLRGNHLTVVQNELDELSRAANDELRVASYLLESEYLQVWMDALDALPQGASLLAVCGDKTWTHVPVFEYLKKNTDIAEEKNVFVHRVYLEPSAGFDPAEWALIERHLQWQRDKSVRFKVSVVLDKKAAQLRKEYALPDGFGLVIPIGRSPHAMIHYGLGDGGRRARIYRDQRIADVYKWIHGQLAASAVSTNKVEERLNDVEKDYSMVDQFISLPPNMRQTV